MNYTRICVKLFDKFNEEERYQTNNLELVYCFLDLNEDNVLERYFFNKALYYTQNLPIGPITKQYYRAIIKYRIAKRTLKAGIQHDHT